jgi:serine protease
MKISLRPWIGAALALGSVLGAVAALATGTGTGTGTEASIVARDRAALLAHDAAQGRVLVRFKDGASVLPRTVQSVVNRVPPHGPQAADTLSKRHGLVLKDGRTLDERTQVVMGTGIDSASLRSRLLADPEVESVWIDHRRFPSATLPDDPLFPAISTVATPSNPRVEAGQWYLRAPDSTTVSAIDALDAWKITWGDANLVVAVVDTGVRPEHPDLQGKLLPGYDFIANVAVANDGNGRDSDPTDVGDWITASENTSGQFKDCGVSDSTWHGTQVSGIIGAATDNGVGMAGTARDVQLLPVRVLGKCGGYDSDIAAGMLWAGGIHVDNVPDNAHPARVINLSLGGTAEDCSSTIYHDTITQLLAKNVVIVAAAGNEGTAVDTPGNCAGVIAVAAIRSAGDKVDFSSLGPEVGVSAPGGNCVNIGDNQPCLYPILSLSNTGTTTAISSTYTTSFGAVSLGTSFSAPQVSGTAALMLSVNPALTPAQVTSMIKSTARPFPTSGGSSGGIGTCTAPTSTAQGECYCTTTTCGAGMLDARAAVAAAAGQTGASVDIEPATRTPLMGSTVVLDGSAATPSPGATIVGYAWTITSGSAYASFASATNGPTATLNANAIGSFTVELTVTDSAGQVGKSFRTLTVVASAPTAVITGATTFAAGEHGVFDGSTSHAVATRTIAGYQWSLGAGQTAANIEGSSTSSSVTLHGLAAGMVTLTLTVTDNAGETASTSETVTVTGPTDSGGGGGSFGLAACAGLLLALAALRRPRPQPARVRARRD